MPQKTKRSTSKKDQNQSEIKKQKTTEKRQLPRETEPPVVSNRHIATVAGIFGAMIGLVIVFNFLGGGKQLRTQLVESSENVTVADPYDNKDADLGIDIQGDLEPQDAMGEISLEIADPVLTKLESSGEVTSGYVLQRVKTVYGEGPGGELAFDNSNPVSIQENVADGEVPISYANGSPLESSYSPIPLTKEFFQDEIAISGEVFFWEKQEGISSPSDTDTLALVADGWTCWETGVVTPENSISTWSCARGETVDFSKTIAFEWPQEEIQFCNPDNFKAELTIDDSDSRNVIYNAGDVVTVPLGPDVFGNIALLGFSDIKNIQWTDDDMTSFGSDFSGDNNTLESIFNFHNPSSFEGVVLVTAEDTTNPECKIEFAFEGMEQQPQVYTCTVDRTKGDIDGIDGVTQADAEIVFNMYMGTVDMPVDISCIDMNDDGEITPGDSQQISALVNQLSTCSAKISGIVWYDANQDGIKAPSPTDVEDGISGIEVALIEKPVGPDSNRQVTTTNSPGVFYFSDVCPGEYLLDPNVNNLGSAIGVSSDDIVITVDGPQNISIVEGTEDLNGILLGYAGQPQDCVQEGDYFEVSEGKSCCDGLTPKNYSSLTGGGYCSGGGLTTICVNCGDGICGTGEDICTCRDDCAQQPPSCNLQLVKTNTIEEVNSIEFTTGQLVSFNLNVSGYADQNNLEWEISDPQNLGINGGIFNSNPSLFQLLANSSQPGEASLTVRDTSVGGCELTIPINVTGDQPPQDCVQEGDYFEVSEGKSCCDGLTPKNYSSLTGGGYCSGGGLTTICVNCGDGICGTGEDICTCRDDCAQQPPITSTCSNVDGSIYENQELFFDAIYNDYTRTEIKGACSQPEGYVEGSLTLNQSEQDPTEGIYEWQCQGENRTCSSFVENLPPVQQTYECSDDSIMGDINGDGNVTLEDAQLLEDMIFERNGLSLPEPGKRCCMDLNRIGGVSTGDVHKIEQIVNGYIDPMGTCADQEPLVCKLDDFKVLSDPGAEEINQQNPITATVGEGYDPEGLRISILAYSASENIRWEVVQDNLGINFITDEETFAFDGTPAAAGTATLRVSDTQPSVDGQTCQVEVPIIISENTNPPTCQNNFGIALNDDTTDTPISDFSMTVGDFPPVLRAVNYSDMGNLVWGLDAGETDLVGLIEYDDIYDMGFTSWKSGTANLELRDTLGNDDLSDDCVSNLTINVDPKECSLENFLIYDVYELITDPDPQPVSEVNFVAGQTNSYTDLLVQGFSESSAVSWSPDFQDTGVSGQQDSSIGVVFTFPANDGSGLNAGTSGSLTVSDSNYPGCIRTIPINVAGDQPTCSTGDFHLVDQNGNDIGDSIVFNLGEQPGDNGTPTHVCAQGFSASENVHVQMGSINPPFPGISINPQIDSNNCFALSGTATEATSLSIRIFDNSVDDDSCQDSFSIRVEDSQPTCNLQLTKSQTNQNITSLEFIVGQSSLFNLNVSGFVDSSNLEWEISDPQNTGISGGIFNSNPILYQFPFGQSLQPGTASLIVKDNSAGGCETTIPITVSGDQPTCANTGEPVDGFMDVPEYPTDCCEGLDKFIDFQEEFSVADQCYSTGMTADPVSGVCVDCGDGSCDAPENPCFCPEDCLGQNASDYNTVTEFCQDDDAQNRYCNPPNNSSQSLCSQCAQVACDSDNFQFVIDNPYEPNDGDLIGQLDGQTLTGFDPAGIKIPDQAISSDGTITWGWDIANSQQSFIDGISVVQSNNSFYLEPSDQNPFQAGQATLIVTDSGGDCSASIDVVVTENQDPPTCGVDNEFGIVSMDDTNTIITSLDVTVEELISNMQVVGYSETSNIEWSLQAGDTTFSGIDADDTYIFGSASSATSGQAILTVTDSAGCEASLEINVSGNLNPCAHDGESYSAEFDDYPDACCEGEGLIAWNAGMEIDSVSVEGVCYETSGMSGWPVGKCITCGNGECETKDNYTETPCNCPQDCVDVDEDYHENSDYDTVEDFCQDPGGYDFECDGSPVTANLALCQLCAPNPACNFVINPSSQTVNTTEEATVVANNVTGNIAWDISGAMDSCSSTTNNSCTFDTSQAAGTINVFATDDGIENCTATATVTVVTEQVPCGDGVLDQGEECDDGNNTSDDGCEEDCTLPDTCGAVCTTEIGCGVNDEVTYICNGSICVNEDCPTEENDCNCERDECIPEQFVFTSGNENQAIEIDDTPADVAANTSGRLGEVMWEVVEDSGTGITGHGDESGYYFDTPATAAGTFRVRMYDSMDEENCDPVITITVNQTQQETCNPEVVFTSEDLSFYTGDDLSGTDIVFDASGSSGDLTLNASNCPGISFGDPDCSDDTACTVPLTGTAQATDSANPCAITISDDDREDDSNCEDTMTIIVTDEPADPCNESEFYIDEENRRQDVQVGCEAEDIEAVVTGAVSTPTWTYRADNTGLGREEPATGSIFDFDYRIARNPGTFEAIVTDSGDSGCTARAIVDVDEQLTCNQQCEQNCECETGYCDSATGRCRNENCTGNTSDCICSDCGDGALETNEECDDGNNYSDDGCESDCTLPDHCDAICTDELGCNDGYVCHEGNCRASDCRGEEDCSCSNGSGCTDCTRTAGATIDIEIDNENENEVDVDTDIDGSIRTTGESGKVAPKTGIDLSMSLLIIISLILIIGAIFVWQKTTKA